MKPRSRVVPLAIASSSHANLFAWSASTRDKALTEEVCSRARILTAYALSIEVDDKLLLQIGEWMDFAPSALRSTGQIDMNRGGVAALLKSAPRISKVYFKSLRQETRVGSLDSN
jgi:hypothetical protein